MKTQSPIFSFILVSVVKKERERLKGKTKLKEKTKISSESVLEKSLSMGIYPTLILNMCSVRQAMITLLCIWIPLLSALYLFIQCLFLELLCATQCPGHWPFSSEFRHYIGAFMERTPGGGRHGRSWEVSAITIITKKATWGERSRECGGRKRHFKRF